MEISIEQGLSSAIRFIQDNADSGTQLYFDEIPEQFAVPSVYFPVPATAGRKVTLSSYRNTITLNCWFMEGKDWDAQWKAAKMRDLIMMENCSIPIINEDGTESKRTMRIGEPETRRIDEGIVQLAFPINIYFRPEGEHVKMQKFYAAWQKVTQKYKQEVADYGKE